VKSEVPREHLDIINNHKRPLKITGIDNELPDHIRWDLKEIKPGYRYRLEVEEISKTTGGYIGHLTIQTDSPEKPELVIIINGQIEPK